MVVPYDAECITRLLRTMPPARLETAEPVNFQRHPVAQVVLPARTIREMIDNEKSRRRRA